MTAWRHMTLPPCLRCRISIQVHDWIVTSHPPLPHWTILYRSNHQRLPAPFALSRVDQLGDLTACALNTSRKILLTAGDEDSAFLQTLASFSGLIGDGRRQFVPSFLVPLWWHWRSLGGVRPIAVGCTLRQLLAKIAGQLVVDEMAELLSPRQLGYGVRGGAEAAVHAGRKYLQDLPSGHVLLKLDFKNAFNSIRRDKMLEAVRDLAPDIYPLVHSTYSAPSSLLWGESTIQSAEGVQQGDLCCSALRFTAIASSSIPHYV